MLSLPLDDIRSRRLRGVVLPAEHGAWGLLLEPLVLGLLLAPSWAGLGLSLSVVSLFVARLPLISWLGSLLGRPDRRATKFSLLWALGFGALSLLLLWFAVDRAGPIQLLPLLLVFPLALLQVYEQMARRSRSLNSEIGGSFALAATVSAVVLAAGWGLREAWLVWLVPGLRSILSILYVRAKLRLNKAQPESGRGVLLGHAMAATGFALLAGLGHMPWLVVAAIGWLGARATWGLRPSAERVTPKRLGLMEIFHGVVVIALAVMGYSLGV